MIQCLLAAVLFKGPHAIFFFFLSREEGFEQQNQAEASAALQFPSACGLMLMLRALRS